MKTVSFLVSGSGFLFSSVAKKIATGYIKAHIGCVVTDNGQARVIQRAHALRVPCHIVEPGEYRQKERHDEEILRCMRECKTDLIVAAGYLRLLTPHFIDSFRNRIINVHPSLLPSFPGLKSQEQAFNYGVKVTGCTTHFIDEGVDTGPIIMQSPVWITGSETIETLSEKVLAEETKILSESVRLYCEGRIRIMGKRTVIG